MTTYKWDLDGILNEIDELIDVILNVEDVVIQQQLIAFLEGYRSMIIKRRNLNDTKEEHRILKQIRKKTRIYGIVRNVFYSNKNIRTIEEYPIFEYKDTIIKILVQILEMESVIKIEDSLLTDTSYDELVDTVLEFLSGIDKSYENLMYECIENGMFEIRKLKRISDDTFGQSFLVQDNNYIYINDINETPNFSLGPTIAHEVGHMIHDKANNNVKIIILEAISLTMELLYIDSLPPELCIDKTVLKEKFFGDYLYFLNQLLTQISLKDNILGVEDERKVIYRNVLANNRILHRNGIRPRLCYVAGEFYQGVVYSIGFLIAFKIKELYEEDKERAVYTLKKIISLDSDEQTILKYLEELGIFQEDFIDRIICWVIQNRRTYRKIKE